MRSGGEEPRLGSRELYNEKRNKKNEPSRSFPRRITVIVPSLSPSLRVSTFRVIVDADSGTRCLFAATTRRRKKLGREGGGEGDWQTRRIGSASMKIGGSNSVVIGQGNKG